MDDSKLEETETMTNNGLMDREEFLDKLMDFNESINSIEVEGLVWLFKSRFDRAKGSFINGMFLAGVLEGVSDYRPLLDDIIKKYNIPSDLKKKTAMKRRIKLEVVMDYEKLMKLNNVDTTKGYLTTEENRVIALTANRFLSVDHSVKKVDVCVEDERKVEYTDFGRSNKMGSACGFGFEK